MPFARHRWSLLLLVLHLLFIAGRAYANDDSGLFFDFENVPAKTTFPPPPYSNTTVRLLDDEAWGSFSGSPIVRFNSTMMGVSSINAQHSDWFGAGFGPGTVTGVAFTLLAADFKQQFRIWYQNVDDPEMRLQSIGPFILDKNTAQSFSVPGEVTGFYIEGNIRIPGGVTGVSYYVDNISATMKMPPPGPVIFVPGAAASILKSPSGLEWFDALTVISSWDNLSLDPSKPHPPIVATDALRGVLWNDSYGGFLNALKAAGYKEYLIDEKLGTAKCDEGQKSATLFVFPYDWRLSNATNAAKLSAYVRCAQKIRPGTVQFVAHSMGGLLTRRALLDDPQLSSQTKRVITIGSPFLGAPKAIGALFDGTFFGFRPGSVKELAEFLPALHELLPSRTYFDFVPWTTTAPIEQMWPLRYATVEVDGDPPRSAYTHKDFADYDEFVGEMDRRFPRSSPGSAGRRFHDYPGQDNWSGDTTMKYTHFVGVTDENRTIYRVRQLDVETFETIAGSRFQIKSVPTLQFQYGKGDNTVPLVSARRTPFLTGARTNIQLITGPGSRAGHVAMMSNSSVQSMAISLLKAKPGAPFARLATMADDVFTDVEATYVRLVNAGPIVVRDSAGYTLATSPQNAGEIHVPGASIDAAGEGSHSVVLERDQPYRIDFRSGGGPAEVEILVGLTNLAPRVAIRYQDVQLPAGTPLQLTVQADDHVTLAADSNGDGTFETTLPPIVVSPAEAADLDAPVLEFIGWPRVTITASDAVAGVKRVLVSTDGAIFQTYEGPFTAPKTATRLFAVAEDRVGNRSPVVEYVPAGTPSLTATAIALAAGGAAEWDSPMTISATLTTDGGDPVAGETVSIAIGAFNATAITDNAGAASIVFTPAYTGPLTATASYAGNNAYLDSSASLDFVVQPAKTTLAWQGAASAEYGHTLDLRARLVRGNDIPVMGAELRFEIGGTTVSAITGSSGVAATTIEMRAEPGTVPLSVAFGGDALRASAAMQGSVRVERQRTALEVRNVRNVAAGYENVLSALLRDATDQRPIAGKTIVFSIGNSAAAALTNADGIATVSVTAPGSLNGPVDLSARFDGDTWATPSNATAGVLAYQPSSWVVWGGNAAPLSTGSKVVLYASDWHKQVTGGDYHAAAEFKGYAEIAFLPATLCQAGATTTGEPRLTAGCWSAKAGMGQPPAASGYISVIVATSIDKQQGSIFGNIARVAIVAVDQTAGSTGGTIVAFN